MKKKKDMPSQVKSPFFFFFRVHTSCIGGFDLFSVWVGVRIEFDEVDERIE